MSGGPARFERAPTVVTAVRWDGRDDTVAHIAALGAAFRVVPGHPDGRPASDGLLLAGPDGAQGWVPVPLGTWVVRGGDPEHFWPVDATQFAATYREVP